MGARQTRWRTQYRKELDSVIGSGIELHHGVGDRRREPILLPFRSRPRRRLEENILGRGTGAVEAARKASDARAAREAETVTVRELAAVRENPGGDAMGGRLAELAGIATG